jgi:hypothetical protein
MKLAPILICLAWLVPAPELGIAASQTHKTITCPYLKAELTFRTPSRPLRRSGGAGSAVLPAIDFDYPSKSTLFYIEDGNLLLVASDEEDPARVRIVVSAQLNKARGTYDGQIVVDMGGNQLMLYNGPVSCKVSSS